MHHSIHSLSKTYPNGTQALRAETNTVAPPERRHKWKAALGIAAVLGTGFLILFRHMAMASGSRVIVEPFHIAGNLYYVGASDVTAFLLTGPEGHVLIDGGYPRNAAAIIDGVSKLGFKITDVKVLLNSHAHFDHAGGLAAVQKASGAKLWVSEADADFVAAGGAGLPVVWPLRLLLFTGLLRYPAPHVDHRFKDGAIVRVGPIELTAHITAGHTPGCTSWSFPVRDGDRQLLAVDLCSLTLQGSSLVNPEAYPGIRADYERSFRKLRSLPADIFLASHTDWFNMQGKKAAASPGNASPFIDRPGYLRFIDRAEQDFRDDLAKQLRR